MANTTNKYNINWQIVRTKARKLKDVDVKLKYVMTFLEENASEENLARIKNWAFMARMGYRDQGSKKLFTQTLEQLESFECTMVDSDNTDFTNISDKDLVMVHKDLKKRKFNFQYSKVPQSHIVFMRILEEEMLERGCLIQ